MFYGLLEIEIMNAVWGIQGQDENADISISDIVEKLGEKGIQRAYTTIKTVMDRLVSKSILVRYRSGKKFFYRSAIDKDEAAKNTIETVASQFFANDYVKMIRFIERECEHVLV